MTEGSDFGYEDEGLDYRKYHDDDDKEEVDTT